jgi:hypothetical protein
MPAKNADRVTGSSMATAVSPGRGQGARVTRS